MSDTIIAARKKRGQTHLLAFKGGFGLPFLMASYGPLGCELNLNQTIDVCHDVCHASCMVLTVQGFDWDDGNREKCEKHGVSREEIEMMLAGDPAVAPDWAHSRQEQRYIAVGRNPNGRTMFVAFTYRERREQLLIRPVSARYMHDKEAKHYEHESP